MNSSTYRIMHKLAVAAVAAALCLLVAGISFSFLIPTTHPIPQFIQLVGLLLLAASLLSLRNLTRTHALSLDDARDQYRHLKREVEKCALRYSSLLEGAGTAIFLLDVEKGSLEEVNNIALELFGYSKEEMQALQGRDLVAEEENGRYTSLMAALLRRGRARAEGFRFRRKDGLQFMGDIDARTIELDGERVIRIMIRDVTQKRKAQQEARQRNRELSTLMNFMTRINESLDLQSVLDATLRETIEVLEGDAGIIHLAEEGREHLLLAATHGISCGLREKIGNCSFGTTTPCFIATTSHRHSVEELDGASCSLGRLASSDGWLSSAAAPLLAQGRLIGVMHILSRSRREFSESELSLFATIGSQIGIVIEHARLYAKLSAQTEELSRSYRLLEKESHYLAVSQRKLSHNFAVVEHANRELGRLDKMKSHFLGMISHEFRTPLTGIMSGTEYLLGRLHSIDQDELTVLRTVHEAGVRLNEIVNDLMRVARIEARTMSVNADVLHLGEIVEVMQERFGPLLRDRGQRLVAPDLDHLPYFSADREYLEEIFTKLIENAVKFSSDRGEIVIRGRLVDRHALQEKEKRLAAFCSTFVERIGEASYLEVEVRDNGVGIPPEEQTKIFEKFYEVGDIRHHSSGRHKFQGKGTGVGLAIVKGMVEAHGGMAWVESPSCTGCGSSFFLLLPLEEGVQQPSFPFMPSAESLLDGSR
ncbi:ATP-binding protein [Geobacter sp. DSM 9736]|uniref:sensor histidine kinase n=1 Tax=Geobacter sp. DSM 9736 TaxID=1277350 RepID=UPI000B505391|nr:ATP-binding protein [Geobacter sp. DSM 9736]SNB47214.1 PAS domain S-box-containing protein [Geobacter sp. DSM 9736]